MSEQKTEKVKKSKKQKRKKSKKSSVVFLMLIINVIGLFFISGFLSYNYLINSMSAREDDIPEISESDRIEIYIPLGSSTDKIANILVEEGVIDNPTLFKFLSRFDGYDGMYQSGTHYVSKDLDYYTIMRIFTEKPEAKRIMIPEGYTYMEVLKRLDNNGFGRIGDFVEAANEIIESEDYEYKFMERIPQREHKLEGYLFPDTYEFGLNATEKEIILRMIDTFDLVFKPEYYDKAEELGMTVDEIITLASIIEKEAYDPNERRLIASVFYNRLNSEDPSLKKLQSCATIQYILLNRIGKRKEKLSDDDLKIESLYNTYLHEGLPPGPICNPSKASIEAALNPEESGFLFFVAKGDGFHHFSKTVQEHEKAVRKYSQ